MREVAADADGRRRWEREGSDWVAECREIIVTVSAMPNRDGCQ